MLEGSRLQPGDALDTSRPTRVGHQAYAGAKGEPGELRTLQIARATRAKEP